MINEKQIEDAFFEVGTLKSSHSLIDYEFYDRFRWFPEHGLEYIADRLKISETDILKGISTWSDEDRAYCEKSLYFRQVPYKNLHWKDLDPKTFKSHQSAITYLERESFLYYFPAWLLNFSRFGTVDSDTDENFFLILCDLYFAEKKYFNWLSKDQVRLTIEFLANVKGPYKEDTKLAQLMWESTL